MQHMKYTENSLNILTAKSFKGIGNAWIVKNLQGNESVGTIVNLLKKSLKGETVDVAKFECLKRKFETMLLKKFENYCDGFVALGDPLFPPYRGAVKESERPVFLYYKGDIGLLGRKTRNVSVIGLLKPEGDIEQRERALVDECVRRGAVIVSGLAFGCDSIAHNQTLESNGKTIAILPGPLDNVLPARNKGLACEIVEKGGLLVTEYGNDFKTTMELSSRYKQRDRLQALFCDTIVLAASYAQDSASRWSRLSGQKLDSGARLAMAYAKEYRVPRAVMYDSENDCNNPMFDLNRRMIEEQSDILVIRRDNLIDAVKKIMSENGSSESGTVRQADLFGL